MADSRERGCSHSSRGIQTRRKRERNSYKSGAANPYRRKDVRRYRRAGSRVFGTNLAADYGRNERLVKARPNALESPGMQPVITIHNPRPESRNQRAAFECPTCQEDRTARQVRPEVVKLLNRQAAITSNS